MLDTQGRLSFGAANGRRKDPGLTVGYPAQARPHHRRIINGVVEQVT